jgi:hypothetical protein
MMGLTFLYFPNPNKVHRSSTIDVFFMYFVNVYPSRILPMPRGIDYLLKLRANNLRKPTPPSANANGDRFSVTIVTMVPFGDYCDDFSDAEPKRVRCSVSCQFLIQVSSYFRHEVSQGKTNLT